MTFTCNCPRCGAQFESWELRKWQLPPKIECPNCMPDTAIKFSFLPKWRRANEREEAASQR